MYNHILRRCICTVTRSGCKSIKIFRLIIGYIFKSEFSCCFVEIELQCISSNNGVRERMIVRSFEGNFTKFLLWHANGRRGGKDRHCLIYIQNMNNDILCTYICTITRSSRKSIKIFCFIIRSCFKTHPSRRCIDIKRSTVCTT